MADPQRYERGIAMLRAALGERAAEPAVARHERGIAEGDPDRAHVPTEIAWGMRLARPQLALRDRALVLVASDVAQGAPLALRDHTRLALYAGVTRDEIDEVVFQLTPYVGFPRAREAGVTIRQLYAELDA